MVQQAGPWRGHRGRRWSGGSAKSATRQMEPPAQTWKVLPDPEPEAPPEKTAPGPAREAEDPEPKGPVLPRGPPLMSEKFMERSLLFAGAIYVLLLFDVWYGGLIGRLDGPMMSGLAAVPDGLRAMVGFLFSLPGDKWLLAVVVAVAGLRAWSRGSVWTAGVIAGSSLALALFVEFTKWVVSRPRPETFSAGRDWMPDWFYSTSMAFPSGHSAAPVLVYGLAVVAFFGPALGRRALLPVPHGVPRRVLVSAAVLMFLPGLGRILWGVHWVTDVIGGWLLGVAWLMGTLLVADHLSQTRPGETEEAEEAERWSPADSASGRHSP